jgi:hypothetical protein
VTDWPAVHAGGRFGADDLALRDGGIRAVDADRPQVVLVEQLDGAVS